MGRLYGKNCVQSLREGGISAEIFNVPVGEKSKSIQQLDKIYNRLSKLKVGREDGIIALGGGVVGDLAGLAAATFLRGISLVQVPTTLLSQVDSSVGGKTAINTSYGKNLVGSFFQPKIVLCDLETMFSLRGREFRIGLAEVVKHAVIRDESLFSYLEKNVSKILNQNVRSLEEIVFRNCQIKADVVEIDEKENGVRQILNFGHTLGHALESLYGFSKKLHAILAIDFRTLGTYKIGISLFAKTSEVWALLARPCAKQGPPAAEILVSLIPLFLNNLSILCIHEVI